MIWKDQSAMFPTKIAWSWSAIDHVQSPADWDKNRAGARHILSLYLAESDIQNNFKNRTKYKIKSTTSTRSRAFKICPLRTLETGVSEHQDFKLFWRSMPPDPPSAWPLQRSPDSSVIKKNPTILVGQSFCVNMIPSVFNFSIRKNN